MALIPSKYQQAIYDAFEHGNDSLLIEAVAGSGKTSTLIELANIMQRAFPEQRAVIVAFNKSIAVELQSRITARNVQAMTLHSAGWAAWRRAGGLDWEPRVDQHKVSGIMREVLSYEENKRFGETTRKLVSAAKGIGLVPGKEDFRCQWGVEGLVPDNQDVWESLMDHYSLAEDECSVDCVRRVLARSIELARESCDFDDMLYMPVVVGVPFDRYDVVLVDEAQDVSGIQMEMISRMTFGKWALEADAPEAVAGRDFDLTMQRNGRVIAVGDRAQAIYGFRGAGTTSMDEMKARFGMRELPLSVTYRCPVAVVEHARQWVRQIEAREDAPWGIVLPEGTDWRGQSEIALGAPISGGQDEINRIRTADYEGCDAGRDASTQQVPARSSSLALQGTTDDPESGSSRDNSGITKWRGITDFAPGDAILCRLTRPLVAAAFTLIRNRIPGVHVLGRDIGGGLVAIVKKAKSLQAATVTEFDRWLEDYEHREGTRLRNKGKHAQAGLLGDKCDTLRVFMDRMGEDARVSELISDIERLFVDANGGTKQMVTLATVHKSKGLQWPRVFILDASETMPCKWARQGWEMGQERNIQYVAATRAMHELRYITTGDLR